MKFTFLLPILVLFGCSTKVIEEPIEPIVPAFAEPRAVQQESYTWIVITKDNVDAITKNGGVLIALTPEGYKTINGNQAELRRYIVEQRATIVAYKAYITSNKNK
jgi:hypothetical protein